MKRKGIDTACERGEQAVIISRGRKVLLVSGRKRQDDWTEGSSYD